jgi:hypothetical protein
MMNSLFTFSNSYAALLSSSFSQCRLDYWLSNKVFEQEDGCHRDDEGADDQINVHNNAP